MSAENVKQALFGRLNHYFGVPTGSPPNTAPKHVIMWPNVLTEKPQGKIWLACFFLPGAPKVATLGETGKDEIGGIFQIDVNEPSGNGEKGRKMISDILTCFKGRQKLTFQSQSVTLLTAGEGAARTVDNFYRTSINITWRAFI